MPVQLPDIPEHVRAYIYRVLGAVSLLVVAYGLASEEVVALWVGVISSLIGNGLATANTSRHSDEGQSTWIVALVAAVVCFVLLLALDVIQVR